MKECRYCGTQYQNGLEACPNCGAAAVLTPEEKVAPEAQYEKVKQKVEQGRKSKLAIVAIALVLVVAIVVGAAALLLDDGSKEVMASTGLDKTQLKSVYAAGTTYMEQGDYVNAAREFDKITGYKDAQALSDEAIAKYREAILIQAQSYSDEGRYTEAMMLIDTATATVGVDAAFNAKTNSIKEAYAQALIAQADEKAASGDYAGALELLQTAGGLVAQSADLTKKVTEVNSAYKAKFFAEVDGLISQKNFTQALATLQTIQDVFGNDPDVNQKITATHKAKVLDKLLGYESAHDYAGAIGYINAELASTGNDSVVVTKLNTYKATYKANTMEQAAELLKNDDYEGAISQLKSSLNVLENDGEILAAIAEYETYKPVDLFTLPTVKGESQAYAITEMQQDNYGNEYTTGYRLQLWTLGYSTYSFATYLLNGQYAKLEGMIALPGWQKNSSVPYWLEFYDGDRLIGKTQQLLSGVKPIYFKYDITGVDELTVNFAAAYNQSGSSKCLTSGVFVSK